MDRQQGAESALWWCRDRVVDDAQCVTDAVHVLYADTAAPAAHPNMHQPFKAALGPRSPRLDKGGCHRRSMRQRRLGFRAQRLSVESALK